jgi:glutaminyl-tRNA synthetase
MVVLDPIKVVVEDYPKGKEEEVEALNHPSFPEMGTRKLKFSHEIYIERDDFREDAPESYYRLKPGGEVKLRYCYVLKFKEMKKNKAGEITEIICTHDPATLHDMPKDRKVKGVIHWVSAKHALSSTVRLYEYIMKEGAKSEEAEEGEEEEGAEGDDAKKKAFLKDVNPNSLVVPKDPKLEASLASAKPFERFQFERNGYFCVDKYSKDKPVFNRIIGLVESGLKKAEGESAGRSRKDEQAKAAAEKEAKKKINPKEMFRSQTDLYSQFDDDGVPTHDANGEGLKKSRVNKLKAEWQKQKKLFES